MKKAHCLIIFSLLFSIYCNAQKVEKYYDYNWKECESLDARFYSVIQKTDSGWYRIDYFLGTMFPQMIGLYKDEACKIRNGFFKWLYPNKRLKLIGNFSNNRREGIHISYHYNGMMADSAFYDDDFVRGIQMAWHANGFIADSITAVSENKLVQISWFDNGVPSSAGYYLFGKKDGLWTYYHSNFTISASVKYKKGVIEQARYFSEDGSAITDTSSINKEATFYWKKRNWKDYVETKLFWPNRYNFSRGNKATVVINFYINEDGKVENAYIDIPFHELFDAIALDVIKKSPQWQPARQFSRNVKQLMRQSVTFTQAE